MDADNTVYLYILSDIWSEVWDDYWNVNTEAKIKLNVAVMNSLRFLDNATDRTGLQDILRQIDDTVRIYGSLINGG